MLFESQEDQLIRSAARRLKGRERRLFIAEVTIELCDGSARVSEDRFGWGRQTASKGMQELREGVVIRRAPGGGRPSWEQRDPQLAADIREIVEPKTQTDPELKTSRRYTNKGHRGVRPCLRFSRIVRPACMHACMSTWHDLFECRAQEQSPTSRLLSREGSLSKTENRV